MNAKLTGQRRKEYVEGRGTQCPFCGGDERALEAGKTLPSCGEPGTLLQECCCLSCGGSWVDLFRLADIWDAVSGEEASRASQSRPSRG